MRVIAASSFSRAPYEKNAHIEDGTFINLRSGIFGVADGVSEAYSPSNPLTEYPGHSKLTVTAGQMALRELCFRAVAQDLDTSIIELLFETNEDVKSYHEDEDKEPGADDVGGASFAVCQAGHKGALVVLAGDCFAFFEDDHGLHFITGFDKAAYQLEQQYQKLFANILKDCGGNKQKAWDAYYPHFEAKKIHYTNKAMGSGGYAQLNGDPAMETCLTFESITWDKNPRFLLLGTDGMLTSGSMDPERSEETCQTLRNLYRHGIPAILHWRDTFEKSLHHLEGWPEASLVELQFGS